MNDDGSVVAAFTEEQAAGLTGLTENQLRHWDRSGFYHPAFAADNRREAYSRIYSFSDLVNLQILKVLRVDAGCSLQHLREVKEVLADLGSGAWSRTTLYVLNRKVVFYDPVNDENREPVSGQIVLQVPLKIVRAEMATAADKIRARDNQKVGTFEQTRTVAHNAKVFGGTRIPVNSVMSFAEAGYSAEEIAEEYPSLSVEEIRAAIRDRAA